MLPSPSPVQLNLARVNIQGGSWVIEGFFLSFDFDNRQFFWAVRGSVGKALIGWGVELYGELLTTGGGKERMTRGQVHERKVPKKFHFHPSFALLSFAWPFLRPLHSKVYEILSP